MIIVRASVLFENQNELLANSGTGIFLTELHFRVICLLSASITG